MGDTEVKNRKVNRNKNKIDKNKEIPNPALDPRDEVRNLFCNVFFENLKKMLENKIIIICLVQLIQLTCAKCVRGFGIRWLNSWP